MQDGWTVFWVLIGVWVLLHYTFKSVKVWQREKSRREIAAYIAEGSMTPEQGEKLMRSGERRTND